MAGSIPAFKPGVLPSKAEQILDQPAAADPLDRETLLARFDSIRQCARGGRRAPHKPLLLYALAA